MTERSPTFNWHLLTVNEWINGLINHTFNLCFHAFVFSFTHFAVNQLLLLPLRRGLPNPRVTILNKKEPIFGNENHWETLEKCELGLILPIENRSKLILNSFRDIFKWLHQESRWSYAPQRKHPWSLSDSGAQHFINLPQHIFPKRTVSELFSVIVKGLRRSRAKGWGGERQLG